MFSECEHSCLLHMALACKKRGLSLNETRDSIEQDLHGFSSWFRISQAVETAFSETPHPDLIH